MHNQHRSFLAAVALLAIALAMTGCCGGKDKGKLETAGANPVIGDREELPELPPEVIACGFGPAGTLTTVYFDYDSANLTPAATTALDANSEQLLQLPDTVVQIAGHCDERGTQEYNLALGERRAQAVRNHLRQLGVPGGRLVTISYGEESPAVPGSGEEAWARNRRCEFLRANLN